MIVLVTGAAGFIGSHLVDELIKQRHQVSVLDRVKIKNLKNNKIKYLKINLSNERKLKKAFKNQDVIFHFGGLSGINESIINLTFCDDFCIITDLKFNDLYVSSYGKGTRNTSIFCVNNEPFGLNRTTLINLPGPKYNINF